MKRLVVHVLAAAGLIVLGGLTASALEPHRYVVRAAEAPRYVIADGKGTAQLFVNASTGASDAAVTLLTLKPGASVPPHVHAESSELLYLKAGKVQMRIGGTTVEASAGDVVYIPRGVEHGASVDGNATVEVVQIYVGPGPEQRFTHGERL